MKIINLFLICFVALVACAEKTTKPETAKATEADNQLRGDVDREAVRKAIRQNLSPIKDCYESELKKQKDLNGKIIVDFEIKDDGFIKSTKIKDTTMHNKSVEDCVANVITKIQFPAAPKGKTALVSYPFVFGSSNR
jgi:hypothetical protein